MPVLDRRIIGTGVGGESGGGGRCARCTHRILRDANAIWPILGWPG